MMKDMRTIEIVSACSACGACLNACPVSAVSMDATDLFYTPVVDHECCIGCGKCLHVCPVHKSENGFAPKSAWWGRSRDNQLVKNSSSGGLFSVLADIILQDGGIVFGAAFDDDCQAVRIRSTDEVSLDDLRRSKYVESLVGDAFSRIREQLVTGRKVLFCGTPCQVAGLKSFLQKDYDALYTCDFACGGLPSHTTYRDYIEYLETRYKSKVTAVNFRPKTYGWRAYAVKVDFANGKQYLSPASLDPYFYSFIGKHVNIRENCVDCRFAEHHVSDIVLADFWRHDAIIGSASDDKGLSLLLANTEKGEALISSARDAADLHELDVKAGSYNLKNPSVNEGYREARKRYFDEYSRGGLLAAAKLIGNTSMFNRWKVKLKCMLKGIAKKIK